MTSCIVHGLHLDPSAIAIAIAGACSIAIMCMHASLAIAHQLVLGNVTGTKFSINAYVDLCHGLHAAVALDISRAASCSCTCTYACTSIHICLYVYVYTALRYQIPTHRQLPPRRDAVTDPPV